MQLKSLTARSVFPRLAAGMLAAAALVAMVGSQASADEGYSVMRQITTQWVKPSIMIVLDTSGSMKYTLDESDGTWNFQYSDTLQGNVTSQDDWTDGSSAGRGQGFWMRVSSMHVLTQPPTTFGDDGYSSNSASVDTDNQNGIVWPQSGLAALQPGDLVRVTDYPDDSLDDTVNGIYIVAGTPVDLADNQGVPHQYWYTQFYKMNPDGTFDDSSVYTFPTPDGNDVTGFTIERVTMTSDPNRFTLIDAPQTADFTTGTCYVHTLNAQDNFDVGDVVKLGSFASESGYYIIRRFDGDNVYLSELDASDTFQNQDHCPGGNDKTGITMQRVELPWTLHTMWYFVPPSRMAMVKNVWGDSVNIYQPTVLPDGTDKLGKPYYLFDGAGPTNGAYKEWTGSGDNLTGGSWNNWSPTDRHEPVGDPAYTEVVSPSDLVGEFSKVAHLGLVLYSGASCNPSDGAQVPITTDDASQAATLASLYTQMSVDGADSAGGTSTRAALQRAINGLNTAYQADAKNSCGRSYSVILLTDGQSNGCNTGTSSTFVSCPDNWDQYPPKDADDLWKLTVGGTALKVRTWVIGLSDDVGQCELNFTAYKGRTDASSPEGDGGVDIDSDPYLAGDDSDVFDFGHSSYAYFVNSEVGFLQTLGNLRQALLDILSANLDMASLGGGGGEYTTSPPSVAQSASTLTNVALVPSSEYPSWKGHLRAFGQTLNASTGALEWTQVWDAGDELSSSNTTASNRKIYTWDPSHSNQLVEITTANAASLDTICGNCNIDSGVVDFIRGVGRDWRLGALINTTPAVIGPPNHWRQGTTGEHEAFEDTYRERHPLIWVGSSDGMIHAFDNEDGAEVIALIPPDLLDKQVELAANWAANNAKSPTGQNPHPAGHIYGVANSLRFADVYDASLATYRTILLVPEGPGGTGLHGLDVTHPYPGRTIDGNTRPADPNYDSTAPVIPLWSLTNGGEAGTTALASLGETWSLPAMALMDPGNASSEPETYAVLGSGFRANTANSLIPSSLILNPLTGGVINSHSLANESSGWLVGNQAFADGVLWQTDLGQYYEDNYTDEAVQVDLNGHVWSITGRDLRTRGSIFEVGAGEPLYYAPAVAAYPTVGPAYDLFAFSSGTFYEKSQAVTGISKTFVPKVWLGVRSLENGATNTQPVPITDLPLPEGESGTFSDQAQVIAPPLLLVPANGSTESPFAFYLIYDPERPDPEGDACVGRSFIVQVNFDPENLNNLSNATYPGSLVQTYGAGSGAAGGFALVGDKVVVSQSKVPPGGHVGIMEVPGLTIPPGNPGQNISWWYELR